MRNYSLIRIFLLWSNLFLTTLLSSIRNILIFVIIIGTIVALAPAGAFYAIHLVDKNYALRVNAFTSVDSVLDDYYILAGIITSKVEDGSVRAGDTLIIRDKQLFKVKGEEEVSLNVSSEQGLSLERILKFSYSHNTVRVYENVYHLISGSSGTLVDSLAYTIDGNPPAQQDPTDADTVYYTPKKIDSHFFVLVRDPKPNADYFKEGFDIVQWVWGKVKSKYFTKNEASA